MVTEVLSREEKIRPTTFKPPIIFCGHRFDLKTVQLRFVGTAFGLQGQFSVPVALDHLSKSGFHQAGEASPTAV